MNTLGVHAAERIEKEIANKLKLLNMRAIASVEINIYLVLDVRVARLSMLIVVRSAPPTAAADAGRATLVGTLVATHHLHHQKLLHLVIIIITSLSMSRNRSMERCHPVAMYIMRFLLSPSSSLFIMSSGNKSLDALLPP